MPQPKTQSRLLPDNPPANPFAGNFSQQRIPLSKLNSRQLMERWHRISQEYALAKDTASASVVPRSEKRRATKAVRNLGQKKHRVRKKLHNALLTVADKQKTRELMNVMLKAYTEHVTQHGTDYVDALMAAHNAHKVIVLELEKLMDLEPPILREVAADTFAHYLREK